MQLAARTLPEGESQYAPALAHPLCRDAKPRSSPMAQGCEFTIITSRCGFDALETEWRQLFERCGKSHHVFQNFNWLWHWCNHYAGTENDGTTTLSIVTGRRQGELVLIWPLALHRRYGVTCMVWMGQPVSQYGDILALDGACTEDDIRESWRFICRNVRADLIHLRRVRDDSCIGRFLYEVCNTPTIRLTAPYLDLASARSFKDYEGRFTARARRNRRRLKRRLSDQGTVAFSTHSGGEESGRLARFTVALKRAWVQSRGHISPAIQDARMASFFGDVAAARDRPAGCRVTTLTLDDEPIAAEIAVRHMDRLAIHLMVYKLSFEKSGAGALLTEESIRRSFDDGIATFDLLAPGDAYKMDWADGATDVCDWVYPQTFAGLCYTKIYISLLQKTLKPALNSLPHVARWLVAAIIAHSAPVAP